MSGEQECEHLRGENSLLRAALELVPPLVAENAQLRESLDKARTVLAGSAESVEAFLAAVAVEQDEIRAIIEASPRPFEAATRALLARSAQMAQDVAAWDRDGLLQKEIAGELGRKYPRKGSASYTVRRVQQILAEARKTDGSS